MEPKKNPAVDIHRHRPALFAASLGMSILIMIVAFEWTVAKAPVLPRPDGEMLFKPLVMEYYPHNFTEYKTVVKQQRVINPNRIVEVKQEPAVTTDDPVLTVEPEVLAPDLATIDVAPMPVEVSEEAEWRVVEDMPEPLGGYEGFYKMLGKNLKYPSRDKRNGIEGKIFVEFTVGKTGELSDLRVIKGISELCDQEALRVLSLSRWQPGKQRGVPVKVRMGQIITFRLQH